MPRDEAYFLDILLAARRAVEHASKTNWEKFQKNTLYQDAIVRTIEIIGEAAARVSEETKIAHAEIPWKEIVGMRNRLIHEYLDVDVQKVWQTVKEDIPKLIDKIQPLVPPEVPPPSEKQK